MIEQSVKVASPLLPVLNEFYHLLEDIWQKKEITNNGSYLKKLEEALGEYLEVEHICLTTNGTLPLMMALHALHITGEVITTPYSFVATSHSLLWCNIKPVFVDVDPKTGNMDPEKIEEAITPLTTAIMPVHLYGNPCDTEKIQSIADKHDLKVIYDAAHSFGVQVGGKSLLKNGDISTLSFHATKVFNTIEGGAIVCHNSTMKKKLDAMRNFGFSKNENSTTLGINGKMDEIRAAYGLLNLQQVDRAIETRRQITQQYRNALEKLEGIRLFEHMPNVCYNYSYFPVFIDSKKFGMTRDKLFSKLEDNGVFGKKYFYPLISASPMYRELPSAKPANLPVATKMANEVICLPLHHDMTDKQTQKIIQIIKNHDHMQTI